MTKELLDLFDEAKRIINTIDDFIGDPCAYYDEDYTDLKNFRRNFFKKYNNINFNFKNLKLLFL